MEDCIVNTQVIVADKKEELTNSQQEESSFVSPYSHISNVFDEKSQNDHVRVSPPSVEFTFPATDLRTQEKTIDIVNYTPKPCPVHLIPPDTQYFSVRNLRSKRCLYGGAVMKVRIAFTPDEVRDYNDVLRIRCYAGQNLLIRISAMPLTQLNFPTKIHFGNVPLGQTASVILPMKSVPETKFSFAILTSREDSSIDIYPTWGCIYPGQKPVDIFVIYRPLRYVTLNIDIDIFVPELCKTPHSIKIQAYTRPGLQREKIEIIEKSSWYKDGGKPCPKNRTARLRSIVRTEKIKDTSGQEDGVWRKLENIPLYTPHAVNCILNARDEKTHSQHELLGPFNIYILQMANERSIRRKWFFMRAEEYRQENNAAMVHHKEKVGFGTGIGDDEGFNAILMEREQLWHEYTESSISTPDVELYKREYPMKIRQRILRNSLQHPSTVLPSYSEKESCPMSNYVFRFAKAARRIVLRNRLVNVLEILKRLTPDMIERLQRLISKERRYAKRQELQGRREKAKKTLKS